MERRLVAGCASLSLPANDDVVAMRIFCTTRRWLATNLKGVGDWVRRVCNFVAKSITKSRAASGNSDVPLPATRRAPVDRQFWKKLMRPEWVFHAHVGVLESDAPNPTSRPMVCGCGTAELIGTAFSAKKTKPDRRRRAARLLLSMTQSGVSAENVDWHEEACSCSPSLGRVGTTMQKVLRFGRGAGVIRAVDEAAMCCWN